MTRTHGALLPIVVVFTTAIVATRAQTATPYKLGMFEQNGRLENPVRAAR